MVASCSPTGSCTSSTTNLGNSPCSGEIYLIWFADTTDLVSFSNVTTTLDNAHCINSDELGAQAPFPFVFCTGQGSIGTQGAMETSVRIVGASRSVPILAETIVLDSQTFDTLGIAMATANADVPSCKPRISAPAVAQSGGNYTVSWSAVRDTQTPFVIEESTSRDFTANVVAETVTGTSKKFSHQVTNATTYYYRVRPVRCAGNNPEVSDIAATVVQSPPPLVRDRGDATVHFGSTTPVRFPVFIPGAGPGASFTITSDKTFLTVTPESGALPEQGITVTASADPTGQRAGSVTGALRVTITRPSAGAPKVSAQDTTTTTTIPISISLVTPVAPGAKTTPPANAMIIPVVTHVLGAAGPFLSDVRLTNSSGGPINYQITFTPTETDGTKVSQVTEVAVPPQRTIALDDIVKNFFGIGASNPAEVGFGQLEIRPLNTSSPETFASSRTYASTLNGTFGQFIAAVPFARFATKRTSGLPIPGGPAPGSTPTISLQQIAQSAKFRTNFGLAEGAGEPANGRVRIFNDAGTLLRELAFSLQPGEQKQINRYLETQAGITNLDDGRIEVLVDSTTGAVTAYASVLDQVTTDPLAVMPVDVSQVSADRYVLPGMAEFGGDNNFHSDIRVYNGGATAVTANFTFYPVGGGTPVTTAARTIGAGQVLAIDNVLPAMFGQSATGGSIVITTGSNTSLVATGRTYTNVAGGGTYGQFIPGVVPQEGTGLGERPLQVLQLEQTDGFRSNLGLSELTGNTVDLRITAHFPDSIATPSTTLTLGPYQFLQLLRVMESFAGAGSQTFNGRVTVEVVGGSGRVTAYGSVIDNKSKDPTYVPAQ
jgi:hypothetical protein